MIEKKFYRKILNRRFAIFLGVKLLIFSVVVGRMYKLQVLDSKKYKTLADENRINVLIHMPNRGLIYDMDGQKIAENIINYSFTITPSLIDDLNQLIVELSGYIELSHEEINLMKQVYISKKPNRAYVIKNSMNWDEVAKISTNLLTLSGTEIVTNTIRRYPAKNRYFHIVGYTSSASKKESERDTFYKYPGVQSGKTGIEQVFESYLRGFPGTEEVEVNSRGRTIRQLSIINSKKGYDIHLTLNTKLQDYMTSRLGSQIGAAVLMDANNGNIIASVSSPTLDANKFSKQISSQEWNRIINSANSPLVNKALKGLYPPGSIFKIVVALAALKYGVIDEKEQLFCNGKFYLGNEEFHCWKKHGHSKVNLLKAITESCDSFFYEISLRVGIDRIHKEAISLGVGKQYTNFLEQEMGIVPNKEWKRKRYNEKWQQGETLNSGIGQGFVLLTPLEMAVITSSIVNGGKTVKPNIIKVIKNKKEEIEIDKSSYTNDNAPEDIKYNKAHIKFIKKAMYDVVNKRSGTAWKSRVEDNDYLIGGKTGTSQVRKISLEEREKGIIKNKDLPWKKRDHALFVGFAPYDKPKFVTAVIIEHGGSGSKVAAPIAKDILLAAREVLLGKKTIKVEEKMEEPS